MTWARALAFNFVFFAGTGLIGTIALPVLLTTRSLTMRFARFWASILLSLLKTIVGLDHEIRGIDCIPRNGCIIAMKHQSAWDTIIPLILFDDPAFVMKRELLFVPIFGWYAIRAGAIAIDRKAGAGAFRRMLARARPAAAAARPIIIFPEGTRVAPEARSPYHPGVAALYRALALPLVPAAVNSGLYWGRRSFMKRPGRIVLEFLDPIPPGWPRDRLMAELEERIETATAALLREGSSGSNIQGARHLSFRDAPKEQARNQ